MWSDTDRERFVATMTEYWPGKGVGAMSLKVYLEAVDGYPMAVVLEALKRIKYGEERPYLPTVGKVIAEADSVAGGTGIQRAKTERQRLLEDLAARGAHGTCYWRSPKGVLCRVRALCLELLEEPGTCGIGGVVRYKVKSALPYSDLRDEQLRTIKAEVYFETGGGPEWEEVGGGA